MISVVGHLIEAAVAQTGVIDETHVGAIVACAMLAEVEICCDWATIGCSVCKPIRVPELIDGGPNRYESANAKIYTIVAGI